MDGSPIVFKVKYGDVLRRFKVNTFERKLDLDFDGLKKKIVSLFNFASNAKLMLTYTDEDGDVVTLGDDNDLIDAVHQHLNPLRITVKLSSEDKSKEDDLSNDSSAVDLKSLVSEILNNVPEPVQGIISPVIADLATKVATSISSGNISELLACLSNLGLPNLSQNSENLSTDARDGHSQSSNGSPDGALDVLLNVISELPSNVKAKSQDVTAGTVAGPSGTAIVNTAVQPGKDKPSDTSNASASAHNKNWTMISAPFASRKSENLFISSDWITHLVTEICPLGLLTMA
ncbi:hypothetical protein M569_00491 [Genlisea aurea]|uniref:PB1 domain-containing protein n=1 Tax=Genlisea aurea TaxID=192259 RepID=S8D9Q5_9LAMI|nr:hypothetical protein M569_00491 [Genlisea aurea]